jgi:hypothetical protein
LALRKSNFHQHSVYVSMGLVFSSNYFTKTDYFI